MQKIGEYENFNVICAGIVYRVEVFSKKNGQLRVYEGVTLIAGMIFKGRYILDFETGERINSVANSRAQKRNNPSSIIRDPALWVLGRNKPK